MTLDARHIHFLGYRLDPVARTLAAPDGNDIALNGRAFDVLSYLIEHRPRVIGKDELLSAAWPGRVVEENNLGQAISSLRRALGTDANDHRFIRTVPGRGYSFVAKVEEQRRTTDAQDSAADARPSWWKRHARPIALASILVLALSGAWVWRTHGTVVANDAASTTIAVLPFRSLDPRPGDETLELGIADTVITRLSGATRLRVLSLGSVQAMTGNTVDSLRAGSTLGANYLVEGHLQRHGSMVRVTARLLAMPDGRAVWAGTFDRNERNVFDVQDEIASKVAASLSQTYRVGQKTAGCMGDDPVAYRAYLRGYALINRPGPRTVEQADAAFREALARDPQCARALAGISQAARLRVMVSDGDPEVEFPHAEAAVARALKIDPDSAEAYTEQGMLQFWYRWNWPKAEASFRHAIELNPNLVAAHMGLAHLYANLERNDRAAAEARIGVALDPLSPIVNALAAADWVIIPVDCDEWAMDGMDEIREQVDAIRDAYNPQLEVMGVLATKYTRGRYSVDTINEIANMDLPAFRNPDNSILRIDYSVKVKEAKARHLPVHKICRNIKTSAQYKALAQLVKKCVEGE